MSGQRRTDFQIHLKVQTPHSDPSPSPDYSPHRCRDLFGQIDLQDPSAKISLIQDYIHELYSSTVLSPHHTPVPCTVDHSLACSARREDSRGTLLILRMSLLWGYTAYRRHRTYSFSQCFHYYLSVLSSSPVYPYARSTFLYSE